MPNPLEDKRFQAFKVSLCSRQIRRDYNTGLTLKEARAYPLGIQEDDVGKFIWTYSVSGDNPQGRS